jgi:hypothetical protein
MVPRDVEAAAFGVADLATTDATSSRSRFRRGFFLGEDDVLLLRDFTIISPVGVAARAWARLTGMVQTHGPFAKQWQIRRQP